MRDLEMWVFFRVVMGKLIYCQALCPRCARKTRGTVLQGVVAL